MEVIFIKLKDIMTPNIVFAQPEESLTAVAQKMKDSNIGFVPVCEADRVVGVITDRDMVLRNISQGLDSSNVNVGSIMSKRVIYGTPDMEAYQAAQIMAENQIRRLPIIENDKIVGVVSIGDLAVEPIYKDEAGDALSSISEPSTPQFE
ncbi:MAG: CBS domain-containing protein [Clostridia bacterium]|nr:CBS domain-containing protein [Clostridia bacterium]